MEDKSILEVLTQLESDLKDIQTAKQQIDAVIQTDGKINDNLSGYSKQLASVATQLDSLTKIIRFQVKDIFSNVEDEATKHLNSVVKAISDIEKLSSQIKSNTLNSVTAATEAYHTSCSSVSKDFKDDIDKSANSFHLKTESATSKFSKEASESINKLIQAATELKDSSSDFSGIKKEILQKIADITGTLTELQEIVSHIKESVTDISKTATSLTKNLQTVHTNTTQLLTDCQKHTSTLLEAIKNFKEEFKQSHLEVKNMIKTNKTILWVIVALVIIDIILRFI